MLYIAINYKLIFLYFGCLHWELHGNIYYVPIVCNFTCCDLFEIVGFQWILLISHYESVQNYGNEFNLVWQPLTTAQCTQYNIVEILH